MTNRFSTYLSEDKFSIHLRTPESLQERRAVVSLHDQLLEVAYDASFYNDLFSDPSYLCLCAFEREKKWTTEEVSAQQVLDTDTTGEVLVGVASARSFENARLLGELSGSLCNARTGYILTLCVLPRCRRRGIAKLLIEQMFDKLLHSHFCTRVSLHTLAKNVAAQSLYSSLGFTRLSYLSNHYYFSNRFHDALYMRKELSPIPLHAIVTDSCVRAGGLVNNTITYLLSPFSSLINGISRELVDAIPISVRDLLSPPLVVVDVYRSSPTAGTIEHHQHQPDDRILLV